MKLKSLISPPYNLLMAAASLLAAASFFWKEAVDIHLHDTYFVISSKYFIWAASILLTVFWLIYRAAAKVLLSKILTLVHISITVAGIACYFIF